MADEDLTELVTLKYEPTGLEIERPRGAISGFVNPESPGWVVLDAAGRKKAQQPTTPVKES